MIDVDDGNAVHQPDNGRFHPPDSEKELHSLIKETGAWVPVSLEDSHRLRTLRPERILTPRPVLTLRVNDLGEEERLQDQHGEAWDRAEPGEDEDHRDGVLPGGLRPAGAQ